MIKNVFAPSSSAKGFINDLLEGQSSWQRPNRSIFIWRGVGDADNHKLVPTALRDENRNRLLQLASLQENSLFTKLNPDQKQIYLEFRVVEQFFLMADRAGQSLPDTARDVYKVFDAYGGAETQEQFELVFKNWLAKDIVGIVSLAQHYGLPTRLLDWSYNALTAAFFAAESAVSLMQQNPGNDPDTHFMGVWMASPHDITSIANHHMTCGERELRVEVGSPPRYQNPNLMAQAGLFTWIAGSDSRKLHAAKRPLDDLLEDMYRAQGNTEPPYARPLALLTLPWAHADELLVRLYNLGVSRARLEPGYAGVARSLEQLAELKWRPSRSLMSTK